jgi:dGTPase
VSNGVERSAWTALQQTAAGDKSAWATQIGPVRVQTTMPDLAPRIPSMTYEHVGLQSLLVALTSSNIIVIMSRLDWKNLLSTKRLRPLLGGPPSIKAKSEGRTEFERDYGRTIYSTPFRRLKQKAQVFPLEPSDYVRTRLIHSLEVSTVAEDLATQVARTIPDMKRLDRKLVDAIPLVAATCGLIHDLGNPPFGHAGESAISTWFEGRLKKDKTFLDGLSDQQQQDFLNFEGNAHALRIISRMWLLADDYGLNYTCGTFSAARKYLPASNQLIKTEHPRSKPGYFWSERRVIEVVEEKTGTHGRRHPLTFLVEAADDIVYSVVDLEDGIKRNIFNWDDLYEHLRDTCKGDPVFKQIIDLATRQIGKGKFTGIALSEAMGQAFRISAISEFAIIAKRMFKKRYGPIMEGTYTGELLFDADSEARRLIDACKDYAKKNLYTCRDILKLEIKGRRVIHDLMDLFWESLESWSPNSLPTTKTYAGKIYILISDNYRRVFEKRIKEDPANSKYYKLQLVTDYVAGMTDPFACRLHEDLTSA